MDQNLIQGGQAIVVVLGGGVAIENMAENYLMHHVPPTIKLPLLPAFSPKPLIIPVVTILGAAIASVATGIPIQTALSVGVGVWATSVLTHNAVPSSTPVQAAPAVDPTQPKGA